MNNLLSEQRISLTELAHRENVNPSTVWRWVQRGVRGVKLESFALGAKRFTTCESFHRFVEATTAAAQGIPKATPVARSSRQRESDRQQARAELASAGIV